MKNSFGMVLIALFALVITSFAEDPVKGKDGINTPSVVQVVSPITPVLILSTDMSPVDGVKIEITTTNSLIKK